MALLIGYPTPQDGLSAYQIWLNNGNFGSELDFLADLQGADGLSAYGVWLAAGNSGSVTDYLNSLQGQPGKSAYQTWLDNNNTGSEVDFLNSLKASTAEIGKVFTWDMGVGTASSQNVTQGIGNYVKIGGLVQVSGTILPNATTGSFTIKVKLPFSSKNAITRFQIANFGSWGAPALGDNIYAYVSANSNILNIPIEASTNPHTLFGFSFSYITDYIGTSPPGGIAVPA